MSTREHLEVRALKNDAGAEQARLDLQGPELPEDLLYLWEWFCELHMTRGVSMSGLEPISYREIEAWSHLLVRDPSPLEVEAIMRLDLVTRTANRPDTKPKEEPPKPQRAWPTKKVSNG